MKKCVHCGKEYTDEIVRCSIDGELLMGSESELLSAPESVATSASQPPFLESLPNKASSTPGRTWTDRQMRIFEVVLVCLIAFGGSILLSANHLFNRTYAGSDNSTYGMLRWVNGLLHEVGCLGLLWYVLSRRSRTFIDLGLSWVKQDLGVSILLYLVGTVAFYAVYEVIVATGLTSMDQSTSGARVTHYLFGGGITLATILFQFLNPFFEELIVRAYVMTEVKELTHSLSKPIIISTLLQTSYHFYQGAPMAFSEAATFLVFSIYYSKTNRVAPIILAHLYSDVGVTLLHAMR